MQLIAPNALWWRIVPAFAAGYFLSYGLRTVNAVIAPELARDFALSASELGLLTSAYFLAFGLFQIPLGLLLDHYGPRRVEASLLLVAALGCFFFGWASNLETLVFGRALIGLGVSACLMASFKAFSQWFPLDRLPALTGMVMAAGGIGALASTLPVEAALPLIGWRGVFYVLAGLNVALAATLFFSVPDKPATAGQPLAAQIAALGGIFASRAYWRSAPQAAFFIGGFMAIQSLWALPWMMGVNAMSRSAAAEVLFLMSLAMLAGFLFVAFAATPLARRGVSALHLLAVALGLTLLAELLIGLDAAPAPWLWPVLGFAFSVANLSYSQLARHYPTALAGRVNTALNLLIMAGAFGLQWGIGAAVDALGAAGLAQARAFQFTFAGVFVMQLLGFLWFLPELRHLHHPPHAEELPRHEG